MALFRGKICLQIVINSLAVIALSEMEYNLTSVFAWGLQIIETTPGGSIIRNLHI